MQPCNTQPEPFGAWPWLGGACNYLGVGRGPMCMGTSPPSEAATLSAAAPLAPTLSDMSWAASQP